MEHINQKKVVISYLLTSILIFSISAFTNMIGMVGQQTLPISGSMSNELMMLVQLAIILVANGFLHYVFYFGNLNSSPIAKGVGMGVAFGVIYFVVSVFGLNIYDLNGDSISSLATAMSGKVIEYSSGGLVTAIISVSDIHKWGLLRAF